MRNGRCHDIPVMSVEQRCGYRGFESHRGDGWCEISGNLEPHFLRH